MCYCCRCPGCGFVGCLNDVHTATSSRKTFSHTLTQPTLGATLHDQLPHAPPHREGSPLFFLLPENLPRLFNVPHNHHPPRPLLSSTLVSYQHLSSLLVFSLSPARSCSTLVSIYPPSLSPTLTSPLSLFLYQHRKYNDKHHGLDSSALWLHGQAPLLPQWYRDHPQQP